jgi:hypothetical protein
MPQLLKRTNAPIDWSVGAVANHPVLTSGVGACITAFTEALMGVFLEMIRWEHAPQAVEAWASKRSIRDKLALVHAETKLTGAGHFEVTVKVLDAFTSLSKERNELAHGFFGIVEDRENQFAWRRGAAAAKRMAIGLASSSMRESPKPRTWIYTPKDFAKLAQDCADTFDKIGIALKVLPFFHGVMNPRTTRGSGT